MFRKIGKIKKVLSLGKGLEQEVLKAEIGIL